MRLGKNVLSEEDMMNALTHNGGKKYGFFNRMLSINYKSIRNISYVVRNPWSAEVPYRGGVLALS